MKILTVVSAFGDYARGAQITDSAAVADALDHHAGNVVASQAAEPIKPLDPPPAK